ncbi:uncharacterized protein LOC134221409 [Armigeres subalbatus]|uniref:uncharacterized protein LOC134221409 n=1 Tax=Armigeres subalbatus TaxID=124917 RepID=UPI002ED334B7
MAMRVANAYRTISMDAVCIILGMTPIKILLEEDCACYGLRGTMGARSRIGTSWEHRKHGEVNFYLMQFLSGHGCFRKYLHRFGHAESPLCPACPNCEETPEHVIFDCPRFRAERSWISTVSTRSINPDNIVQEMCENENTWNMVNRAVTQIMLSLQRKWREDQRALDSERRR